MIEALLDANWLKRLANYGKLIVGYSGGLDSTVLLHYLVLQPQLTCKIVAVHVNHGLSPNADVWQAHCQQFCRRRGIPISVHQVAFDKHANVEENARNARYQVFYSQVTKDDCLLLAHHCNDQAETVLLQLMRGSGIDGLAAMASMKTLALGELARPLLQHSRCRLEAYAREHHLIWIDDESNQDNTFSRNYMRNQVLPLLTAKWPSAVKNLAACAVHCQQARINLDDLAVLDCEDLDTERNTLLLSSLQNLSHARLTNVLRAWIKNNDVKMPSAKTFNRLIDEVIMAGNDTKACVQWNEIIIKRYHQTLYILQPNVNLRPKTIEWVNFPEPLHLDNGSHCLESVMVSASSASACEQPAKSLSNDARTMTEADYLYVSQAAEGLHVPTGSRIQVRFRQGGELFHWRGQTKSLKKLFQQWRVPPWCRDAIPLVYIDQRLALVVGYAISDYYYNKSLNRGYHIHFHIPSN